MKMNTSLRNTLIIIILLNIIGVGVYGFLFYSIKSNTESSNELVSQLDADKERNSRFEGIENTIKNIEERAVKLDTYILDVDNVVELLTLLEKSAKEQNVAIKTEIKRNLVKEGESGSPSLGLTYSVTGGWSEILNFVAIVENLPYIVSVENLVLQKSGSDEGGALWSGSIRFTVLTT